MKEANKRQKLCFPKNAPVSQAPPNVTKKNEAANFEDFIYTARFDELVAAVKDLCGFKEESRLNIDFPSLALKLGAA